MRGHVDGGPRGAAVQCLDHAWYVIGAIRSRPVHHLVADHEDAADGRRRVSWQVYDAPPRLSSISGMQQALIARQCTDPANVRIGKTYTPQIDPRRRVLHNPGGTAVGRFYNIAVTV